MKTPLEAPEKSRGRGTEETSAKPVRAETQSVIDTSKMAAGKPAALDPA